MRRAVARMSAWLVIRLALALLSFAVALLSVVALEFGPGQLSACAIGRFRCLRNGWDDSEIHGPIVIGHL